MYDNIVDACEFVDKHGFELSVVSYNNLLHVIQKSSKWDVYEHTIKKRMSPNEVTFRIMANALSK